MRDGGCFKVLATVVTNCKHCSHRYGSTTQKRGPLRSLCVTVEQQLSDLNKSVPY